MLLRRLCLGQSAGLYSSSAIWKKHRLHNKNYLLHQLQSDVIGAHRDFTFPPRETTFWFSNSFLSFHVICEAPGRQNIKVTKILQSFLVVNTNSNNHNKMQMKNQKDRSSIPMNGTNSNRSIFIASKFELTAETCPQSKPDSATFTK